MTRLGTQLRDAAERDAHRAPLGRGLRDIGWRLPAPELSAALAVAVFAVAVVAGVFALGGEEAPPRTPVVVAKLDVTPNPDQIVSAFGSVWIADRVAGDVVRVDPADRRVLARIPIRSGANLFVTPVGGELWATDGDATSLWRIDPATNAVRGRIPLRLPDGKPFVPGGVLASDRAVWVAAAEGALRLDPRTGARLRYVPMATAAGEATWFTLGDDALWMLHSDGTIRRLDPLTGAAQARFRPGLRDIGIIEVAGGALLAGSGGGTVSRLDGATGRVLWEQRVGDRANAAGSGDGLVWVHSSTARERDRLTAFALHDGRRVATIALDTFGATSLAVVGREVWVDTPSGGTVVVRR